MRVNIFCKNKISIGVSEEELVRVAALSMGLSDLKPFVPEENMSMDDTRNEFIQVSGNGFKAFALSNS